ncbi:MAG: acyltransferase domain-containing protein, partial [Planctomycetaceae bacterium]|nr:acyltransferase domain-containing protein [Planctomycetaceae bacterium]
DFAMLRAVEAQGITPDVVLGHSYGEYAALIAAGSWDLKEAIHVTKARCDAIESSLTTQSGLLATSAGADEINQLAGALTERIFIANQNAADQTVVGGKRPVLRDLERLLKARSHHTRMLAVPCAFHTPLMQEAVPPFHRALQQAQIATPQVPIYSVANNRLVKTPDDIRSNLEAHLTQPVRYVELIRQIADEAPTVFVEVGPQQALTRLHARILEESEPNLVACDHLKRPAMEQLACVRALLETCGATDRLATTATGSPHRTEITHFDATVRRRTKMRDAARQQAHMTSAPVASSLASESTTTRRVVEQAPLSAAHQNGARVATASSPRPLPPRAADATVRDTRPHAISVADETAAFELGGNLSASATSANHRDPAPDAVIVPSVQTTATTDTAIDNLELFLVNFVVEQTGYPAEVVELDADLESDLGIDSIKKAQLFGELQEYFEITPTEGMTLDDFPTLRHVVNFLANAAKPTEPVLPPSTQQQAPTPGRANEHNENVASEQAAIADRTEQQPERVPIVQLRGTPFEIGRQHGAEFREEIRRALRRIADMNDGHADELPAATLALADSNPLESEGIKDELRGMADGAGVSLGSLLAWNRILLAELGTDAKHLGICSACAETGRPLHGVRDNLCLMGRLSDCLKPLVQIREETGRLPCTVVTFVGFVGALAGMNSRRLSI